MSPAGERVLMCVLRDEVIVDCQAAEMSHRRNHPRVPPPWFQDFEKFGGSPGSRRVRLYCTAPGRTDTNWNREKSYGW